jgi:hypothetical protein
MEKGSVNGWESMPMAMGSSACSQLTGCGISLLTILQYKKPRKASVITKDTIDIMFMCVVSFFLF